MSILAAYSRLLKEKGSHDEETYGDSESDSEAGMLPPRRQHNGRLNNVSHWLTHFASIIIICFLLYQTTIRSSRSFQTCMERFNAHSPVLEGVDPKFQEIRFKYSLWYQSPFKGPPSPVVEEYWHDIMRYGQISVTADDILRIGHNLSAVQYPESVGGGYPATAMGTHAIHCLHYIWQDHYIDVLPDVRSKKHNITEMYERHYEHCVDYIRQYLMCKFDTTIMPFNWVLDHQNPTPNGNTIHKCVNWDHLQEWLKGRAVEMPDGFRWKQPPDAVTLDWNP